VHEGRELLGDDPALLLLEVDIVRRAGELATGRDLLREGLQRHATFRRGWVRLLGLCDEDGRDVEIVQLFEKPPPAMADQAVLCGYAAAVFRRRGDFGLARQALERAIALDPTYEWGRHTLCEILLGLGQPELVFDLLPAATTPEQLSFRQAALLTEAAARSGRRDVAVPLYLRLLRQEDSTGEVLVHLDELMTKHFGMDHLRAVDAALAAASATAPTGPFVENHLCLLARRTDLPRFYAGLTKLQSALPPETADRIVGRILADASRVVPHDGLADWARDHLQPPIDDIEAFGQLAYALNGGRRGAEECVRLLGGNWRRLDACGWMLANIAEAFHLVGRPLDMEAVSRHAVTHIAEDHSLVWHRRFLAEAALGRGDFARVRELAATTEVRDAGVRQSLLELDLLAELRCSPWWRRGLLLRRRLPALLAALLEANAERTRPEPIVLRVADLLRAAPGITSLLLFLTRNRVERFRRLALLRR